MLKEGVLYLFLLNVKFKSFYVIEAAVDKNENFIW